MAQPFLEEEDDEESAENASLVEGEEVVDTPDFEALLEHLRRDRGFDFHGYKRATLVRRIQRRMQAVEKTNFRDYLAFLEENPEEFPQLFNTILINVTAFFRDSESWEHLRNEVLPAALALKSNDMPIRAWSAGCASGEEAFSIAMTLAELMGVDDVVRRVKIYATDIDDEALAHGRQATYGAREVANIPAPLLAKYFDLVGERYAFHKELRRCVIFGRHDLMQDAPISRIDLLLCRNTIMYFKAERQKTILTRLHFALNDNGLLFLGKAEMLLSHPTLFTPIDLKRRIFGAIPKARLRERLPPRALENLASDETSIDARLGNANFEGGPIAQLVIDAEGKIAQVNERARLLFDVTPRDIGRPMRDLELSYKPIELRSCIDQVYRDRRQMSLKQVEWPVRIGDALSFDVEVVPLLEDNVVLGVQISFIDITQSKRLQRELRAANRELEAAYEEIQSTSEELETTNEELQSTVEELETTNEELETTNEELQSTNEELVTMNEEAQSANEELQTVNGDLRVWGGGLNDENSFLSAILSTLHAGIVVLDGDLLIRIWNEKSEDLWGLRAGEVAGKNFLNLDIGLPVAELRAPIRACLADDRGHEEVAVAARDRRGKPIKCAVKCTRLSDAGNGVPGVIVWVEYEQQDPS